MELEFLHVNLGGHKYFAHSRDPPSPQVTLSLPKEMDNLTGDLCHKAGPGSHAGLGQQRWLSLLSFSWDQALCLGFPRQCPHVHVTVSETPSQTRVYTPHTQTHTETFSCTHSHTHTNTTHTDTLRQPTQHTSTLAQTQTTLTHTHSHSHTHTQWHRSRFCACGHDLESWTGS